MTMVIGAGAPGTGETGGGWCVEPAGPRDRAGLEALFASCSPQTVRSRFFGRPRALPQPYFDDALAGPPALHDAVIGHAGDRSRPAGMAGLVARPYDPGEYDWCDQECDGCDECDGCGEYEGGEYGAGGCEAGAHGDRRIADLGVLVADGFQRRGLGGAMVGTLLARARARGVTRVSASVLPHRAALLAALGRRPELEPVGGSVTGDARTGVYRLL